MESSKQDTDPKEDGTKKSRTNSTFLKGRKGSISPQKKSEEFKNPLKMSGFKKNRKSKENVHQFSYDPDVADKTVRPNEILRDERFFQVARTITYFVAGSITDKYSIYKPELSESDKEKRKARRLRETLIELGPTFIKLGQFLSVRRDILSPEMADELAYLQDKVPPFEFSKVKEIIERELGRSPDKIFDEFSEDPVASASIGQVHRALLKDGRQVVVKVQRPDLASRFYQDLGYMRLVTKMGMAVKPTGEWENWFKLSDEFGKNLFSEINYLQEGKNADRIRQILKNDPDILIPRVIWKYTGKRVLTLEYIPGIKIDNIEELKDSGLDLIEIGNKLVQCYLDQVLMNGFFHADPHAGNMAIDAHGRIVLYDFGMIGNITELQRNAITGCVAAVIKKDVKELIKHLCDLEIIKKDANLEPVERAITPFIDYYAGKGIKEIDFGRIEDDVDEIAGQRAIRMPPTLAYLMRTGTSLEGIARTLDPNFSFVEAAKPTLKKWIISHPDQAMQVLKMMGADSPMSIRSVWQKLVKSRIPDNSLNFLGDSTVKLESDFEKNLELGSSSDQLDSQKPYQDVAEEVTLLKNRVYDLEQDLEVAQKNKVNLLVQTLWFLSFAILFLGASLIPELQPYAKYFLIGNVVMVAKIIRHLVRSSNKLLGRSASETQRGGYGDKRC